MNIWAFFFVMMMKSVSGGRVGRAAGAGAGDDRDLRHEAGEEHVAEEDLAVAGERVVAFLDARAAGIVDADDRHAGLQGVVHQVADLLRVDAAERAAADGEVLAEPVIADAPPLVWGNSSRIASTRQRRPDIAALRASVPIPRPKRQAGRKVRFPSTFPADRPAAPWTNPARAFAASATLPWR
jgi:hypothetical protein